MRDDGEQPSEAASEVRVSEAKSFLKNVLQPSFERYREVHREGGPPFLTWASKEGLLPEAELDGDSRLQWRSHDIRVEVDGLRLQAATVGDDGTRIQLDAGTVTVQKPSGHAVAP